MSDVKKNNATETETRTPYSIEMNPLPFEEDFSGKIITSVQLCKLTNQLYRAGFADYAGCTFEVVNGVPVMSMYFNHTRPTEDGVYACERGDGKAAGNTILDRSRNRDRQMREGDRYKITEDGKDVIAKLLHPRFYNNGKPQWGNLVSDITDRSAANFYNPNAAVQLTKITGIDPRRICAKLWGSEDDSDYGVEVKSNLAFNNPAMPAGQQSPNYVLSITKAFSENIKKTYESLGIGAMGSNIIR